MEPKSKLLHKRYANKSNEFGCRDSERIGTIISANKQERQKYRRYAQGADKI